MPSLPPYLGGAIGYFGYDTDQLLERVPATAVDERLPELDIGTYDWVLATDHLSGEGWIFATRPLTGKKAHACTSRKHPRRLDIPPSSARRFGLGAQVVRP